MIRPFPSAAYRISFLYSAVFALAIALLGAAVYFAAHAAFTHQLEVRIAEDSAALAAEYREEGAAAVHKAIAEREAGNTSNERLYALFAADGRRIDGAMDTVRPDAGWQDIVFNDPREGRDAARALAVDLPDGSRLVVAADRAAIGQSDRTIISLFLLAFLVVVGLSAGGALLLGHYLRRRLGTISDTAEAIMQGDLAQRIPVGPRGDEFDRLSASLNAMLERIDDLLGNLRQLSGDIAHDLRTPLTRLRNRLEQAIDAPADRAGQQAALEDALLRVDELLSLFAAILRISEIEGGSLRSVFRAVDIGELVRDLCESYAPAAEDGGRRLGWSAEPGLVIDGDRELAAQAVINLLDNALIHTPEGAAIHVAVEKCDGRIALHISDNGPGIRAEDRVRALRRFVRLDASRSTAGHGLGLNLVAAIASAHEAELILADNAPGLVVTLRFPVRRT